MICTNVTKKTLKDNLIEHIEHPTCPHTHTQKKETDSANVHADGKKAFVVKMV